MTTIDDILREETLSPRAANFIKELASAIREAVEREREACAKIAEGDLFEVRYRSWPHWNPGGNLSRERDVTQLAEATAAAIRARGEEKGK